ncbi:thiol peroxidase [Larsenimonas rhizosphaerae]|uniref:Thiol peroxidase n=1 Tax=Larsenimonas rhizosphaerae TaxID=2944682 RepID=A0AA42CUK7_9GAMM|nr:thiol peroxidase [Larsenimonas rhizosphaerae]MCM2129804.1 thiol peroxidase [Larsenimonas rhizosphaerae]MCX2524464.1 thiol peroxidase [Larsenimonas rhizosphaerae]
MSQVKLGDTDVSVKGHFPEKGEQVSDFTLTGQDLAEVSLADFEGQRKVISIIPSVDTGVCATSTRTFNQKASSLADTVVLVVSADLPFAAARFCGAEGLENVKTLSTFRHPEFAEHHGVLIADGPMTGLCARGVIVLDEKNTVLYSELCPQIKAEPGYEDALAALNG